MGNANVRSIAAPPEDLEEEVHEEDAERRAFESNLSLRTCPFIEVNQVVVRVILDIRTNVWKTQELGDLIKEFFETSFRNQELVSAMESFLKHARDRQFRVLCALQQLDDGETEAGGDNRYSRTLEEPTEFKAAGDPFTEEFFVICRLAYSNQISLLVRLESSMDRLDKNISCYHRWKKVTKLTFSATSEVVKVCSVVADGMGSPPVAATLEAAAARVPRR